MPSLEKPGGVLEQLAAIDEDLDRRIDERGGDVVDNAAIVLDTGGGPADKIAITGVTCDWVEHTAANLHSAGVMEAGLPGLLDERSPVADNFHKLYDDARRVTGTWSYPALAQLTGESLRTLQRHHRISTSAGMAKLILATHAKDPDLARRLAVAGGHDLNALGIAPPPAPPPPKSAPVDPRPPVERHRQDGESVLLAAAHAANLPPEAIRPAVAAALARARDLGASPADLAAQLAKPLGSATKG